MSKRYIVIKDTIWWTILDQKTKLTISVRITSYYSEGKFSRKKDARRFCRFLNAEDNHG